VDVTVIGLIVIGIGMWLLWRGSTLDMLCFVLVCALFGGSATVKLTALGNTSIQPSVLATFLLAMRSFWPGPGKSTILSRALSTHTVLLVFVLYGVISAAVMPRLFENDIMVAPLRSIKSTYIYAVYPLRPTTQNLTTSVYLLITFLAGTATYVAACDEAAPARIARWAAICGLVHASLGFLSVVAKGTPIDALFGLVRNGNYAQLSQDVGGIVRMSGVFPEPSIFCLTALIFFAFLVELWLRDIDRRWTGPSAAMLLAALLASTATTAYLGLGFWVLLNGLRILAFPRSIRFSKVALTGGLLSLAVVIGALTIAVYPNLFTQLSDAVASVTVDKLDSRSGQQRLFYAMQGVTAFLYSGGLGIGAGSFRSSGMLAAILGSMGVIGVVTFMAHWLRAVGPMARLTYVPSGDLRRDVGAAASWGALLMVFPMSFSWPTPDPGLVWSMMCGIALALRQNEKAVRSAPVSMVPA